MQQCLLNLYREMKKKLLLKFSILFRMGYTVKCSLPPGVSHNEKSFFFTCIPSQVIIRTVKILHTGDTESLHVWGQQHQYPNGQKQTERKRKKRETNYVTCNLSGVTCQVSRVACHLTPVTNANSHSHRPSPDLLKANSFAQSEFFNLNFAQRNVLKTL